MTDGARKLDNGSWNARYVGPDCRRCPRTFRVKRDATTWRGKELRLIDLDAWTRPASRKPARGVDGPTAAAMSAEAGATVREIQEQLGHTTSQMALRYQTAAALRDAKRARRVSDAWNR